MRYFSKMRKILLIIVYLLIFIFPSRAIASEGWVIDNFKSNISIEPSGVVDVDETIDVDFDTLSKHGIYRDVPYIYDSGGTNIYTEMDHISVLQNSQPAKYQVLKDNDFIRLKIGDPDRIISGKNTYTIKYQVKGVLKSFKDHDEFYWNITGNNWPVGILSATAAVTLPRDGIQKTDCFEGNVGSLDRCNIYQTNSNSVQFKSTNNLRENQGLTAVVGYQKGMVPILTVKKPLSFWEKFISWPSQLTLFTAIFFGIATIVYLWHKYGRDYWFAQNLFGSKNEEGVVKPINAHETTVVEFTPPDSLRPGEIGVIADEVANTNDVTATIIDLAGRGYFTITELPKKWLFGSTDYELHKKEKSVSNLLTYERILLNKLFLDRQIVKISELKTKFYEELKEIKEELYKDVVAKNFFPDDPEKVRTKYLVIAIIMIFGCIFAGAFGISVENIFIADLSLGILVSGIILAGMSRFMPRRTAYGREIYRRIKGYRMFIESAEKYRQQFFEKQNLFNEVLPYAIVFGLTGKFAEALKEMGLKTTQPAWYIGAHPFNTIAFANNMNDFSRSMSSAIASAPQSSGFSGGGGYSGGGFGGGGGGSW